MPGGTRKRSPVSREYFRDEPGHQLTTIWAARTLSALGRFADALEVGRQLPTQARTPYVRSCVAYALAGMGAADEARRLCAELRREADTGAPISLFLMAGAQTRLGDLEAALDTLMECHRMRDGQLVFLLARTSFDDLRGQPGYERVLEEMSFPTQLGPGNVAGLTVAVHP